MTTILPISSNCHSLQLPPIEKDDRLNLNVRTGSASTLYNSLIFTFGGLTIGLDLYKLSIPEILSTFNAELNNSKPKNLLRYLSGELFYLNLIDKVWSRVVIESPTATNKPQPRLFHEVLALNNCLYVFGGLIINPKYNITDSMPVSDLPSDILVPSNDLWEFNLEKKQWNLLYHTKYKHKHQKHNKAFDPTPRFCHKMTHLDSLSFANKPDHYGIFIAGGKDQDSQLLYDNLIFDLVDKKFINHKFSLTVNTSKSEADYMANTDSDNNLNVDYFNSIIVKLNDHFHHYQDHHPSAHKPKKSRDNNDSSAPSFSFHDSRHDNNYDESIVVYSPVKDCAKVSNPLLSFRVGKSIKTGRLLPVHRKINDSHSAANLIIPFNLRYPTGGLFGQNLIITGFLPNDYDISIFVYNKPTGKWSRLNIFCNHDYGSHRFWGGYAWQSHHKVVLIGNYVTSRTTSSIRYFSCLITVNLPVTNILASSELAGGGHYHDADGNRIYFDQMKLLTDESTDSSVNLSSSCGEDSGDDSGNDSSHSNAKDEDTIPQIDRPLTPPMDSRRPSYASRGSRGSNSTTKSPRAISFSEYVHYAAPTTNFTTIRSIFPPAAITLGRNFLDRFGDLISDFEIISVSGDRIPVSLMVLIERWGNYFIELLANGYVNAVQKFDQSQRAINAGSKSPSQSSAGSLSNKQWTGLKSSFTSFGSSVSSGNSHEKSINSNTSNPNNTNTNEASNEEDPKADRSYHLSMPMTQRKPQKDAPHFRLPFQDPPSNTPDKSIDQSLSLPQEKNIDPQFSQPIQPDSDARKDSTSSFSSGNSLLNSHLQDIPPQLPLPTEPVPPVPSNPSSFRSSSRRNSNDLQSPRGSLLHTLTALRNIPLSKSPRGSPFTSPRASVSQQGGAASSNLGPLASGNSSGNSSGSGTPVVGMGITTPDLTHSPIPNLRPSKSSSTNLNTKLEQSETVESLQDLGPDQSPFDKKDSQNSKEEVNVSKEGPTEESDAKFDPFDNILLNFENLENGTFQMESSLIPRKLYIPFATTSVKAFCEYLYTGQVGNKWLLSPTALDNLALAKHYKVPLLYDLISEVLYGIIGKRESFIIKRANELKADYFKLLRETSSSHDPDFEFPLDEYEGLMDTVDDGFLDITLLKKSLKNKGPRHSEFKKRDLTSKASSRKSSRRSSTFDKPGYDPEDIEEQDAKEQEDPGKGDHEASVGDGSAVDKGDNEASGESDSGKDSSSLENLESSTSETEVLDIMGDGYLEQHDMPNMGPRSKSIFDRGDLESGQARNSMEELELDDKRKEEQHQRERELGSTLEQLVSPVSPVPSVHIIDLIFENVVFVADLKLILRTSNAKQMSHLLDQFEADMAQKMQEVRAKHEERQQLFRARNSRTPSSNSVQQQRIPLVHRGSSYDGEDIKLKPVGSSSSLTTVSSRHTFGSVGHSSSLNQNASVKPEAPGESAENTPKSTAVSSGTQTPTSLANPAGSLGSIPLERARTNSSIRSGISGLTPFKPVKTESKLNRAETNREVDKRITKLIKKDEKLKQKAEREEKLRAQQQLKQEKSHSKRAQTFDSSTRNTGSNNTPNLSRTSSKIFDDSSSVEDVSSTSSKKKFGHHHHHHHHHGILHHIGLGHKSKEKDHKDSNNDLSGSESNMAKSDSPNSLHSKSSSTLEGSKKKHGLFGLKK